VLRPAGPWILCRCDDLAEPADYHELAGLVDEVDAGDLDDLASDLQDQIPKMGIPKK